MERPKWGPLTETFTRLVSLSNETLQNCAPKYLGLSVDERINILETEIALHLDPLREIETQFVIGERYLTFDEIARLTRQLRESLETSFRTLAQVKHDATDLFFSTSPIAELVAEEQRVFAIFNELAWLENATLAVARHGDDGLQHRNLGSPTAPDARRTYFVRRIGQVVKELFGLQAAGVIKDITNIVFDRNYTRKQIEKKLSGLKVPPETATN